jgi:hypothetical protein
MGEIEARLAAARAIADLSTDDLTQAILADDSLAQVATARFTPPTGSLTLSDLSEAHHATEEVIAMLEDRLAEISADFQRLPRPATPAAETGSRIDVSG